MHLPPKKTDRSRAAPPAESRTWAPNFGRRRFPPLLPPPSSPPEGMAGRSLVGGGDGEVLSSSRAGPLARAGVFG